MFRVVFAALVIHALAFGAPTEADVMPVLADISGTEFPVVARKDGRYFQVFVVKSNDAPAPYFSDTDGNSHYVTSGGTEFPLFYQSGAEFRPLPRGAASREAATTATVRTLGGSSSNADTQLVHWRGYGGYYYGGYYRNCYPQRYYPIYQPYYQPYYRPYYREYAYARPYYPQQYYFYGNYGVDYVTYNSYQCYPQRYVIGCG